jgi:hypothetical protein
VNYQECRTSSHEQLTLIDAVKRYVVRRRRIQEILSGVLVPCQHTYTIEYMRRLNQINSHLCFCQKVKKDTAMHGVPLQRDTAMHGVP